MRKRDLRKLRQHHERERTTERHGHLYGYITDGCRCDLCRKAMRDWQRARRAKERPWSRYLTATAQVRAAERREQDLAKVKAEATPELSELIREQERDSYFVILPRPWLVSLDAPWGYAESGDDHYERGGIVAYTARRRGDFSTEAPWVEPLIERLDRERECECGVAT